MKSERGKTQIYEFGGEYRLFAAEKVLWRGNDLVNLTNKAAELLVILVERSGAVVSKEELVETLWHDTYVDQNNLAVTISMLRRVFGESAHDKRFIETVPRRGYRFAAEVSEASSAALIFERHTKTDIIIEEENTTVEDCSPLASPKFSSIENKPRNVRARTVVLGLLVAAVCGFIVWKNAGGNDIRKTLIPGDSHKRSVAVLPFEFNQSNLADSKTANELTEAIAFDLALTTRVLPLDTVRAQNPNRENFLLVGRETGADAVLIGMLFADPAQIYLRVHLINAHDGEILWAETFKIAPDKKNSLIEAITQNTANNLPRISDTEIYRQTARRFTQNEQAYALYLQGRTIWRGRGDVFENPAVAVKYFEDALRLDPDFILPLLGMADYQKTNDYHSPSLAQARGYLRRVLGIAPDLAEAHAALGFVKMVHDWNWSDAEKEFQMALRLDPDCVNALQWYAMMLSLQGRFSEAEMRISTARRLSPYSISVERDEAEICYLKRGYRNAWNSAAQADFQVSGSTEKILGDVLWQQGNYEAAIKYLVSRSDGINSEERLTTAFKEEGARGLARLMVERYRRDKKFDVLASYWIAEWLSVSNERKQALDFLERAAREHHFFIIQAKADPFFDNLREEPRFRSVLKEIGLYQ